MNTLQEISEKLLLALYKIHREEGEILEESISFDKEEQWEVSGGNQELVDALLSLADGSVLDFKNSLKYLNEKDLISFKTQGYLGGEVEIYNLEVTSNAIDVIEGVTGAETSKAVYQTIFNVKLADNINLESLITAKLGAEFKLF